MVTIIRRVGPVRMPFVVQAVWVFLLGRADHGHMPVPAVIVLGSFILSIFAGVLCFGNYLGQPTAIRWLYPPIMFLMLVIFSLAVGPFLGVDVAI